jgi:anti-sigma regulatory factor (Ser/Thr protein kinase)
VALARQHYLIRLAREADIYTTRELASSLAQTVGFDGYQVAAIETAVSELCSNAIKFGIRGWAVLRVSDGDFEARVTDEGPGFEAAPTDRAGLGVGLAGAGRLMDELRVDRVDGVTEVFVKKSRPRFQSSAAVPSIWEMSVVSRLKTGSAVSGDRWWTARSEQPLVAVVVDGLGSGEKAAEASQAVIDAFARQDPSAPLTHMMQTAHRAATSTRGAVALVARLDGSTVEYCGVGDVGGWARSSGTLISQPGVLGVELPDLVPRFVDWGSDSRLAMWTDGLKPTAEMFASIPDGDGIKGWLDELAFSHGTERDDGLLFTLSGMPGTPADRHP